MEEPSVHEPPKAEEAWPAACWGLVRRRTCWRLTWRGWSLLVLLIVGLGAAGVIGLHPFLAITRPVYGGALVVEGWLPDYALQAAIEEFRQHPYDKLYVTGVPLERGRPLSEYRTHAELGAVILQRLGLEASAIQAVPAPPVRQDRTYVSAAALAQWWREHRVAPRQVHVISMGPHARRTRLLFEKALGAGVTVGITAVPSRDYEPRRWWRSSAGVRATLDELIAYGYARLLFRPGEGTRDRDP